MGLVRGHKEVVIVGGHQVCADAVVLICYVCDYLLTHVLPFKTKPIEQYTLLSLYLIMT